MTVIWLPSCSGVVMGNIPSSSQPSSTPPHSSEITLRKAIELLKTAKIAANRRPVYVAELVRVLKQITRGIEDKPISYLDAARIEEFLAQRNFCPMARKCFIGRVSTLFAFAKRRKLTRFNPCDELERPIT